MRCEQPVRVEEPLIELLLERAAKKGQSLVQLAKEMGVSYQRLTQYRRGEARLSNARQTTVRNISIYLDMPVVLVMVLSGSLGLHELQWPGDAQRGRIQWALESMRHDPCVGPLMPSTLEQAPLDVQRFVLWLYGQYTAACNAGIDSAYQTRWTEILAQLNPFPAPQ